MTQLIKNTIIFFVIGFFILVAPLQIEWKMIFSLIILPSAAWVYVDAKKIEIHKYKKTKLSLSDTPFGSAIAVVLLWVIAFPLYIMWRQKIMSGKIELVDSMHKGVNIQESPDFLKGFFIIFSLYIIISIIIILGFSSIV